MWKINTSNKNKLEEFRRYLGNVEAFSHDLEEPDSDLITVIQYKASQFEDVLVDDTSLEIEGIEAGVNIKWLLEKMPDFIGRKAIFTCLLGINREGKISIFKGVTEGRIVAEAGNSFGFNNYFLPDGSQKTFGEEIPDEINPRKIAVDHLKSNQSFQQLPILKVWNGKFQK